MLKKEKYIDLIMYILAKCYNKPNVGKSVLCSLMYFIDLNYYEIYGELMTNEIYIKTKKGIKAKHFQDITQELISKKQLFLRKEPYYHRTIHRYYPLIIPTNSFDEKELELINYNINKLSDNNAFNILKYANKDPPLRLTTFGEEINCEYVFFRYEKNK